MKSLDREESVSFVEKFDAFLCIDDCTQLRECLPRKKKKLRSGEVKPAIATKLLNILEQGFGDRVKILEQRPWQPDEDPSDLVIGLRLNPDLYHRVIDRGPSADSPEAASFRELWGDKSEMRKFADGSICETVLWSPNNAMERRRIVGEMAKYLLQRHFKIPSDSVHFSQHLLESVLVPSRSFPGNRIRTTGEEQFRALCETYEKFSHVLRALDGLPLSLTKVQGISPSLRYTEVFPPGLNSSPVAKACVYVRENCFVPRPSGLYAPPWNPSHEVHITLEATGKWPENVEAVRKLKCAFYLKLGQLLNEQFQLRSQAFEDSLLVMMESFIFRVIIAYPREVVLLKMRKDDRGVLMARNNKDSMALELATTHASRHAAHILGLVHAHASYPLTCRLVRRWLCCHMLSDFIRAEAVELLVASLYLDIGPFGGVPGSAFGGFLRFLKLLTTHNWLTKPLIVNVNMEITADELSDIRSKFVSLRPTLPPMCIVTPTDHMGSRWTRPQPSAVIVERLCNLAKASLEILESSAFRLSESIVQAIFKPMLHVYDVLIRLRARRVPRRWMAFQLSEKSSKKREIDDPIKGEEFWQRFPVVDFDPTECFLRELRKSYDRYALFFYDSCGGDVIGVLWRPRMRKSFEVVNEKVKKENEDGADEDTETIGRLPKISEILQNFSALGKGLVEKVDIVNSVEIS